MHKKQRKKCGHLPAKKAEMEPWAHVNVDLIGPHTIKCPTKTHKLQAMTMIDPATSWFEIAPILEEPNSDATQRILDSMWLAWCPRPKEMGFDNGSESEWPFAELCQSFGPKQKTVLDHNPQSNAILERVHQVLGNAFRTFEFQILLSHS